MWNIYSVWACLCWAVWDSAKTGFLNSRTSKGRCALVSLWPKFHCKPKRSRETRCWWDEWPRGHLRAHRKPSRRPLSPNFSTAKEEISDELKGHRVKIMLSVPLVLNLFCLHICWPRLLLLASITPLTVISEFVLLLLDTSPWALL